MVYVKKIRMRFGYKDSNRLTDVESILLEDESMSEFLPVTLVHDLLVRNPNSVKLFKEPCHLLIPTMIDGKKCVRSIASDLAHDHLLHLPRS